MNGYVVSSSAWDTSTFKPRTMVAILHMKQGLLVGQIVEIENAEMACAIVHESEAIDPSADRSDD